LYVIAFPHLLWLNPVSVRWLIYCQKHVTALILWRQTILACHWHTATDIQNCKCLSGPRNTLNIMPIINKIFVLVSANNVTYFSCGSTAPWGPRPPHFSRLHDLTQTHHTR
jgi:hypothetical protein